ncbi:MAG: helix-turn-helix transcriptional regulator [Acidimicrobiia bacterium]
MNSATLIRTARNRAGLTQAQLAARLGTYQPVISAYENGQREPSIEMLRRIVGGAGSQLRIELKRCESSTSGVVSDDLALTSPRHHADALVDVLLLADALPAGRRRKLEFPGIAST